MLLKVQSDLQHLILGIPFTTKESTSCSRMKSTFGLACRKFIVADEDAEIIRLMKDAGGILIGTLFILLLTCIARPTWEERNGNIRR